MLYHEIWPDVPPDFRYPSSFQLLIYREVMNSKQFVRKTTLSLGHLSFLCWEWCQRNLVFTDFSLFILLFFTSSFGGLQQPREGTALSFEVLNYTVIFLKTAAPYLFGSTFYRWPVFTHYTAKGNYVLPFQIYTAHKICLLKFRHFHQWAYNQFPVFAAFFFFFFMFLKETSLLPGLHRGKCLVSALRRSCREVVVMDDRHI